MSMFSTLVQTGLLPIAPATSQAGEGAQTPVARTPKQRVQVYQVPGYIQKPLVAPVQHETRVAACEVEQVRLDRYMKCHHLPSVTMFIQLCQHPIVFQLLLELRSPIMHHQYPVCLLIEVLLPASLAG